MKNALCLAFLFAPMAFAAELPASQAYAHVGESVTVCGLVTGIHYATGSRGKPTFVNFDKPYPNQDFTVMIWDDDRAGFGNLSGLSGKNACAHGTVTEYRGKPEMVLHSPGALLARP